MNQVGLDQASRGGATLRIMDNQRQAVLDKHLKDVGHNIKLEGLHRKRERERERERGREREREGERERERQRGERRGERGGEEREGRGERGRERR